MLGNMGKELIKTAANFAVFFLILLVYTKIAGPLPFSVNSVTTTKATTFDVTAEGKVSVKPDSANVSAGVSATGTTPTQVQEKINLIVNKVSSSIKSLEIDAKDIKTSNYNINPTYNESQKINGYSGNATLTIKVRDINKAGQVIDAATEAGATNVASLGFDVADKTKFENEARKQAVDKAKKKAEDAAKIAGFRLGRIVNYSENFGGFPRPVPLSAESKTLETPTNLEPGTEEISVTVTLSFEID